MKKPKSLNDRLFNLGNMRKPGSILPSLSFTRFILLSLFALLMVIPIAAVGFYLSEGWAIGVFLLSLLFLALYLRTFFNWLAIDVYGSLFRKRGYAIAIGLFPLLLYVIAFSLSPFTSIAGAGIGVGLAYVFGLYVPICFVYSITILFLIRNAMGKPAKRNLLEYRFSLCTRPCVEKEGEMQDNGEVIPAIPLAHDTKYWPDNLL